MSHRRPLVAAVIAALSAALLAVPAAAGTPAPATSSSAWVVNRTQGAFGVPVTPAAMDTGNSAGGTNTITRTVKGKYTVKLGGITDASGTVQVTPINSERRWCNVASWNPVASDLVITLSCQAADASFANTSFVLTYTTGDGGHGSNAGRLAYAWSDDGTVSGTPDPYFQYTSALTTITIAKGAPGSGRATLTLPSMGQTGGNVQLTTYDGIATCRAIGWSPSGSDEVIEVGCHSPQGVTSDAVFDVLFLSRLGPEGFGGGPSAHLVATKPKAANYTAPAPYAFNSKGKAISILRGSVGNYTVILTGMPAGGAAIVTPFGTGTAKCQLSSLGTKVPMKAIVRCFNTAGSAVDAKFSLAYTK